ncbi:MAG: TIR domain-containing protein [Methanoregula sp.]|nr:MAG: TIR domain-containing protein [Methanoregula sp.]
MPPPDEFSRPNVNHHDVFISYAQLDKPIADAVCAKLESRHIRCWIAPRDVPPGKNFPEAIIDAIEESKVVTLIFSSHANNSPHVLREVTKAVNKGCIIVPFRVEDVVPSKSMEYLISVPHWLDAITPPLEKHIDELAGNVERILLSSKEPAVCASCKTPLSSNALFCENCGKPVTAIVPQAATPPPPPVAEPLPEKPVDKPAKVAEGEAPPLPVSPKAHPGRNRKLLIGAGIIVAVLVALVFAFIINPATLLQPIGISINGGAASPVTATPTPVNYRSGNAPINTVILTTVPTQVLPEGNSLTIVAEKNPVDAEVVVKFEGGRGQGLVLDNQVILTRSDGTVTQGKLDFSRKPSEVTLQGTRGTDRLQVIVTMRSGATYAIVDQLLPYRVRG